jgi:hypothetical protein
VKTRLAGDGPFKTTDEAVKNAFIRFVELEIAFPDQFMRFTLVANCDFYDVGKAETNLRHVLDLLRSTSTLSELREANSCVRAEMGTRNLDTLL